MGEATGRSTEMKREAGRLGHWKMGAQEVRVCELPQTALGIGQYQPALARQRATEVHRTRTQGRVDMALLFADKHQVARKRPAG